VPFPESPHAAAYIQGDLDHTSGSQADITRIVVHCTVSPTKVGGARGNASYFQSPGAGGLAHYVVDPGEVVQCAPENTVCWHAPFNERSIGVELCDPQAGDPGRWQDADHQAMLARAADLIRDIAARWSVPLAFVDAAGLRAGQRGITGHTHVSQAFNQSTHTDPGDAFPWPQFMALLNGSPAAPAPAAPSPTMAALLAGGTDTDMKWFFTKTNAHGDTVFQTNTVVCYRMKDMNHLKATQFWLSRQGYTADDLAIQMNNNLDSLGVEIHA
jgi:N-acetyl-anhydromuramyl-L-alanine amidase AmpD